MKIISIGLMMLFSLSACTGESQTDRDANSNASYRVTFIANWTEARFPTSFPVGNDHFSGLIGATHNNQINFWEVGQRASEGLEEVAETGSKTLFTEEIQQEKIAQTAEFLLSGSPLPTGTSRTFLEFDINESHPLVTLISMIAPSPDWFVGVHDLALFNNGQWVQNLDINLPLYDAGTDSGDIFTSFNANSNGLISRLTSSFSDTNFRNGVGNSGSYVGRFIFERIR